MELGLNQVQQQAYRITPATLQGHQTSLHGLEIMCQMLLELCITLKLTTFMEMIKFKLQRELPNHCIFKHKS